MLREDRVHLQRGISLLLQVAGEAIEHEVAQLGVRLGREGLESRVDQLFQRQVELVLDQDLPTWVPVPPIAEMQVALQAAVAQVTGLTGDNLKTRMRTGTVVTTDDRNWELRHDDRYLRFNQSRAIAIDMESATIAANGFRFRVPYGTLLCVSDKPLHGDIKLPGMASQFYRERVDQHLRIGMRAVDLLRQQRSDRLHSRKLRSFTEVAFQ